MDILNLVTQTRVKLVADIEYRKEVLEDYKKIAGQKSAYSIRQNIIHQQKLFDLSEQRLENYESALFELAKTFDLSNNEYKNIEIK